VLPTAFEVFAPLPLVIALFGIYAIGRMERRRDYVDPGLVRFAVVADVWWAAAALFCKPLVLISQALLEPTPVAIWLMVVVATAPVLVVALVCSRRVRAWPLFAIGTFGTLIVLADL